jgi:hypothetical protein
MSYTAQSSLLSLICARVIIRCVLLLQTSTRRRSGLITDILSSW